MSEKTVLAKQNENLELIRQIALKLLKTSPAQNAAISNLEDLVNLLIEHKLNDLQLPPFPNKIESEVRLNFDVEDSPTNSHSDKEHDLWIFGYGSLVWKADFPYLLRRIGFIRGFERRFYQNSIDHRGTLEKPGRVVTLIPSSNQNSLVWGVAYQIANSEKENVLKHLDYREKNGYQRHTVHFYPYSPDHGRSCSAWDIIIYVATEKNESFAGHINDLDAIANQAYTAVGPSGTNREYVYKLANAMRQLFPGEKDDHLFALERKLREREKREFNLNRKLHADVTSLIKQAIDAGQPNLDNLEKLVNSQIEEFSKNNKIRTNDYKKKSLVDETARKPHETEKKWGKPIKTNWMDNSSKLKY